MSNETSQAAGSAAVAPCKQTKEELVVLLQKPYQGPLEALAQKSGLSIKDVVSCLPQANQSHIDGARFIEIMETIATWGDVLLILNTDDGVFECSGAIIPGSVGMGYYNLGHGSAISGHLRHDRCRDIYCVSRQFHKMDTCSVQFFNEQGGCMFKLFVGRGEDGKLKPEQVRCFEKLSGLSVG